MSPVCKQLVWLFLAAITIPLAGAITVVWPGSISTLLAGLTVVVVEAVSLGNIGFIAQEEWLRLTMKPMQPNQEI